MLLCCRVVVDDVGDHAMLEHSVCIGFMLFFHDTHRLSKNFSL